MQLHKLWKCAPQVLYRLHMSKHTVASKMWQTVRKIKGQLAEMGFAFTENPDEADFILYNTCAVRENAESKVFGKVGELKHKKKRKPSLVTALCGCMAEQDHVVERIKKSYPYLDLVFGTHVIHYLPQLLYAL